MARALVAEAVDVGVPPGRERLQQGVLLDSGEIGRLSQVVPQDAGVFEHGLRLEHVGQVRPGQYLAVAAVVVDDLPQHPGRVTLEPAGQLVGEHPDDERAPELRKYQEEIELLQLERNFASRARLARDQPLLPIERDYMEAVSHSASNPDLAIARLRAIIDMYGAPTGNDRDRERQILQLAERQLKRLNEQVQEQAPAYLKIIDRRLAHANEIKRETPLESTRIWQSIIVLYGDKPWAADRVEMARAALAEAPTSKNAD